MAVDLSDVVDTAGCALASVGAGCAEFLVLRAVSVPLQRATRSSLIVALTEIALTRGTHWRHKALRTLAGVSAGGDARTARLAARCVRDHEADVRHAATKALERAAENLECAEAADLAVSSLGPALLDSNTRVSAAAARAFPRLVPRGHKGAVRAAAAGVSHPASASRRASIAVLAEVVERGDAAVIASISQAAQCDVEWQVRVTAARALPRIAERGDKVASAALEKCLGDSNSTVQHTAVAALVHISERPSARFLAWGPASAAGSSCRGPRAAASKAGPATGQVRVQRKRASKDQMLYLESPLAPAAQRRRLAAATATPSKTSRGGVRGMAT